MGMEDTGAADTGTFDMASALEDMSGSLFPDEGGSGEGDTDPDDFITDAPQPTEAPTAAPTAEPSAAPTTAPGAAPAEGGPPKTWRPEAAALWAQVPPAVQAEIAKREQDMFQGIETYKNDATVGKTIQSVFAPYQQVLAQHNVDPMMLTSNLFRAHYMLSTAEGQQKVDLFHKLAGLYGIDLKTSQQDADPPYVDPATASLQNEVRTVKSQLQSIESARQQEMERQAQAARSQIESEITAFAADPANVYFNEIAADVAAQLRAGAKDLKEAYERAVYANPVTRAKEIARVTAENEAKAKAAAAEAAKKASAATAANVRSTARSGSGTAPSKGIEGIGDTMAQTLASIKSRG